MKSRSVLAAALLSTASAAVWLAREAEAEETLSAKFQYAAKVTCSFLTPALDGNLAQGTYRTTINVHNPTERKIAFARKVAIASNVGDPPSDFSPTPFKKAELLPDDAVQLHCFDVAGFFCPTANGLCIDFAYFDGFIVIESPVELDVVAVYTARHSGAEGEVETMDVETVPARRVLKVVKIPADAGPREIKERIKYPPSKSPAPY